MYAKRFIKTLRRHRVPSRVFASSLTISIVSLLIVAFLSVNIYINISTNRLQEKEANYLELYAASIINEIKNIDAEIAVFIQQPQIQNMLLSAPNKTDTQRAENTVLATLAASDTLHLFNAVQDCYVFTNDYTPIGIFNGIHSDLNWNDMDYKTLLRKTHLQLGTSAIICTGTDYSNSQSFNQRGVFYVKRIVDNTTRYNIGYIVLYLNKSVLFGMDMYNTDSPIPISDLHIIDHTGALIYSTAEKPDYILPQAVAGQLEKNPVAQRFPFSVDEISPLSTNALAYVGIINAFFGWSIVSVIPYTTLLPEIYSTALIILSVVVFLIILCALISKAIGNSISQPIQGILQCLSRIQNEDFSPAPADSNQDELATVQNLLNDTSIRLKELIDQIRAAERRANDLRFRALQAQINPHFLVNTINSVIWLAELQNAHNIKNLASSLTQILIMSMQNNHVLTPIADEIVLLKNYIEIMQYRYLDRFDVSFNMEPGIDRYYAPKFFMQPFLENSLIHGMNEQSILQFKIDITVRSDGDDIAIIIADNGNGIPHDKLEAILSGRAESPKRGGITSIGIHNINERIHLQYGCNYGVHIESVLNAGTVVTIRIPKQGGPEDDFYTVG